MPSLFSSSSAKRRSISTSTVERGQPESAAISSIFSSKREGQRKVIECLFTMAILHQPGSCAILNPDTSPTFNKMGKAPTLAQARPRHKEAAVAAAANVAQQTLCESLPSSGITTAQPPPPSNFYSSFNAADPSRSSNKRRIAEAVLLCHKCVGTQHIPPLERGVSHPSPGREKGKRLNSPAAGG